MGDDTPIAPFARAPRPIYTFFRQRFAQVTNPPIDPLRESLAEPLRRLIPEPESGIVRGIVLGERASVDADLATAFARSGTSHLLAISGFNMTLVAAGVAMLARGRVRPEIAAIGTVLAVASYSVLVGLAPSVLRASLMAGVAACGVAFGRRPATTNGLAGAVAVMLAIDASRVPRPNPRDFGLAHARAYARPATAVSLGTRRA